MNRILRISLDTLLTSAIPIISWFILGLLINKNLINIFTLTYPVQFMYGMLKAIFGTGANISSNKDKNKDIVLSGMILGIVIGGGIFGTLVLNVNKYISFMNMDIEIYRIFCIYSIIQIYLQLVLSLVLEKLYFEGNNKKANKYAIFFNFLNFFILIGMSLITKNQSLIVIISLIVMSMFTIYIVTRSLRKFRFKLNIFDCIKYESVEIFTQLGFILTYLFGLSNCFNFGNKYVLAITFDALITDAQWDISRAIDTVAKIDICKKEFVYKEHLKNAYKLIFLLIISITIMFIALYRLYNPDLLIIAIFLGLEIINFILYPLFEIKTCYLQLEYSALKTTINKEVANSTRIFTSLLKTPYCTAIGQVVSMVYQLIYVNVIWKKEKIYNMQIDKKE